MVSHYISLCIVLCRIHFAKRLVDCEICFRRASYFTISCHLDLVYTNKNVVIFSWNIMLSLYFVACLLGGIFQILYHLMHILSCCISHMVRLTVPLHSQQKELGNQILLTRPGVFLTCWQLMFLHLWYSFFLFMLSTFK